MVERLDGTFGSKQKGIEKKSNAGWNSSPTLSVLLKDKEVQGFFRFVNSNDLREKAVELLEKHLSKNKLH